MAKSDWNSEGHEPDYRFSLANERTFLAWIRMSLAILAGAVALEQFAVGLEPRVAVVTLSILMALAAAVVCISSYLRWRGNQIAMRRSRPLPPSPMLYLVAAGAVCAAMAMAALFVNSGMRTL